MSILHVLGKKFCVWFACLCMINSYTSKPDIIYSYRFLFLSIFYLSVLDQGVLFNYSSIIVDFSTSLCGLLFIFEALLSSLSLLMIIMLFVECSFIMHRSASVLLLRPFGLTLTLHNRFCFDYDPSVVYLVVFFYGNVYTQ